MNHKHLDDFLRTYQSETDVVPSRHVIESILAVPGQVGQNRRFSFARPWHWFDLMIPRAVGWAVTCGLGIYIGLVTPDPGFIPMDEEYYMYDQTQVLLSEVQQETLLATVPEDQNGEDFD